MVLAAFSTGAPPALIVTVAIQDDLDHVTGFRFCLWNSSGPLPFQAIQDPLDESAGSIMCWLGRNCCCCCCCSQGEVVASSQRFVESLMVSRQKTMIASYIIVRTSSFTKPDHFVVTLHRNCFSFFLVPPRRLLSSSSFFFFLLSWLQWQNDFIECIGQWTSSRNSPNHWFECQSI